MLAKLLEIIQYTTGCLGAVSQSRLAKQPLRVAAANDMNKAALMLESAGNATGLFVTYHKATRPAAGPSGTEIPETEVCLHATVGKLNDRSTWIHLDFAHWPESATYRDLWEACNGKPELSLGTACAVPAPRYVAQGKETSET